MYRNILVVLSEPRTSTDVLREAIALAQRSHGRLTVLCPVTRPPAWLAGPMTAVACEPLARELEQEAERLLDAARTAVPRDIPLTTILSRRSLREAVRARLGEQPHDLLVLGGDRLGRRFERRCAVPLHRVPPLPAPAPVPVAGVSGTPLRLRARLARAS